MKIFKNVETRDRVIVSCTKQQEPIVCVQLKNTFKNGDWIVESELESGNFIYIYEASLYKGLFSTVKFDYYI